MNGSEESVLNLGFEKVCLNWLVRLDMDGICVYAWTELVWGCFTLFATTLANSLHQLVAYGHLLVIGRSIPNMEKPDNLGRNGL